MIKINELLNWKMWRAVNVELTLLLVLMINSTKFLTLQNAYLLVFALGTVLYKFADALICLSKIVYIDFDKYMIYLPPLA